MSTRSARTIRWTNQAESDVQQYADQHGITFSGAVNVLVQEGLAVVRKRRGECSCTPEWAEANTGAGADPGRPA